MDCRADPSKAAKGITRWELEMDTVGAAEGRGYFLQPSDVYGRMGNGQMWHDLLAAAMPICRASRVMAYAAFCFVFLLFFFYFNLSVKINL